MSGSEIIGTNGYSYGYFEPTSLAISRYSKWPIPSTNQPIGKVASLSNRNFVFGNSLAIVYVDKETGSLIHMTYLAGLINSISVVNDKIYISDRNSLVVAEIQNNKIKVVARTNFDHAFGGNFNIVSSRVVGSQVFVACGIRGTYVFNLKKS